MLRKFLLALFVIVFCLMVGCRANDSSTSSTVENINVLKSELFEDATDEKKVKIEYPQIENKSDNITSKINESIKSAAFDNYIEKWNNENLALDQSYIIERNESELLSIVFKRYLYFVRTAHPNFTCYAVKYIHFPIILNHTNH